MTVLSDEDEPELDPDLLIDITEYRESLSGSGTGFGDFGDEARYDDHDVLGHLQHGPDEDLQSHFGTSETGRLRRTGSIATMHTLAFELASASESRMSDNDLLASLDANSLPPERSREVDDMDRLPALDVAQAFVSHPSTPGMHNKAVRSTTSRASIRSQRMSGDWRRNGPTSPQDPSAPAAREDEEASALFTQYDDILRNNIGSIASFLVLLKGCLSTDCYAPSDESDMLAVTERSASRLTKATYELFKKREDQCKELKEILTQLDDCDPVWQTIISEMPDLPVWANPTNSSDLQNQAVARFGVDTGSTSPSQFGTADHGRNITTALANLRRSNEALVDSFGNLAEQLQVGKAATTDAARKMRTLEQTLSRMKQEMEFTEHSREKISVWERDIPKTELNSSRRRSVMVSALPGLASPRSRKTSTSSITSNGSGLGEMSIVHGTLGRQAKGELVAASALIEATHTEHTSCCHADSHQYYCKRMHTTPVISVLDIIGRFHEFSRPGYVRVEHSVVLHSEVLVTSKH